MNESMPFLLSRPRRSPSARRPDVAGGRDASPRSARSSARELEEHVSRMAVSLEWLAQALSGVPEDTDARRTLEGYVTELTGLLRAIELVQGRASEPRLARVFERSAPLVRYLEALFAWSEGLVAAFEEIAAGLRRGEPVRPVFLLRSINTSYARLEELMHAGRAALKGADLGSEAARTLDVDLEELSWAASWLHLSLTRRFGE